MNEPSTLTTAQAAVLEHLRGFFAGHRVEVREPPDARVHERLPGLEFVLVAPDAAPRHALWIAMAAYYHANPDDAGFRLDIGHTVPMGEPWSPGSACDHLLVSLPYPFGRDLEICAWDGGHARLLWLLPITAAERDFKAANGLEALEQRFDEVALKYWDTGRASVV